MTFVPVLDQPPLEGVLRYVESEHSFTFDVASPVDLQERSGADGLTSLSVGTLQVEVGVATGLVLFVWGVHPRASWRIQPVGYPKPTMNGARIDTSRPMQRGVSLPLAGVGEWVTTFDDVTGWVHVAKDPGMASGQELLVATGVVLGVTDGRLNSLWLQPVFE